MKLLFFLTVLLSAVYCNAQKVVLFPVQEVRSILHEPRDIVYNVEEALYPNISYMLIGAFNNKPFKQVFFHQTLPMTPDPLTYATVIYANSHYFRKSYDVLNSAGRAQTTVKIPNCRCLVGTTIYWLAMTWTPGRRFRLHISVPSELIITE